MNLSKTKVFLYASDIAAYIGQNKYDFVTPFERLWKRCDSECYNKIINSSKDEITKDKLQLSELESAERMLQEQLKSKNITEKKYNSEIKKINEKKSVIGDKVETLEKEIDAIDLNQKQKLTKVLGKAFIDNLESKDIQTDVKRQTFDTHIDTLDISKDDKDLIKRETTSFINKTHGTLEEETAIEMYEKKFGVKLDTSQSFNKVLLKSTETFDWYICGKVDGLYKGSGDGEPLGEPLGEPYVVEVKNRTRGFFSTLRDYEKTQIQLYMYMLGLNQAKLVEKYRNKIRITVVYRDDTYINDILQYTKIFVDNFTNKFLNNVDKKLEFVKQTTDLKKTYLQKLYLNEINTKINEKIMVKQQSEDVACFIDDLD